MSTWLCPGLVCWVQPGAMCTGAARNSKQANDAMAETSMIFKACAVTVEVCDESVYPMWCPNSVWGLHSEEIVCPAACSISHFSLQHIYYLLSPVAVLLPGGQSMRSFVLPLMPQGGHAPHRWRWASRRGISRQETLIMHPTAVQRGLCQCGVLACMLYRRRGALIVRLCNTRVHARQA